MIWFWGVLQDVFGALERLCDRACRWAATRRFEAQCVEWEREGR